MKKSIETINMNLGGYREGVVQRRGIQWGFGGVGCSLCLSLAIGSWMFVFYILLM